MPNHHWVILTLLLWLGFNTPPALANETYVEAIAAELKIARSNLTASQERRDRIAAQIAQLQQTGNSSPETVADARFYLERLQAMVQENQAWVARLEALYTEHTGKPPPPGQSDRVLSPMLDPAIPEERIGDEVAVLDRALDDSLAEFDARLLQELALMRRQSGEKMTDLAAEAAAAARRLKEKGIDLGMEKDSGRDSQQEGSSGDPSESPSGSPEKSGTMSRQTGERAEVDTGTSDQSAERGPDGTQSPSKQSRDRHGGKEDDDIVARQLREAAEKETDPELKEKLWKEYEDYKKNQQ